MRFIGNLHRRRAPCQSGGSRSLLPSLLGIGGPYRTKAALCHSFVVLFGAFSRDPHKSGRRSLVRASAAARRQEATLAWSPDVRISGIRRPSKVWGRVYWGYSSRDSAKLSSAADS